MANETAEQRFAASLKRKGQGTFTASEQRDALVKQEIEKERAALAARTAKLKALRLAKEAEEKAAAERLAAANPPPAPKPKAKAKPRKAPASA
ncbi:MAG TPA: hypothetical protein VG891_05025 [Rhizomicrobium sp.]|nr:hypothetical protein [Rhizomicrobium sp.]